VVDPREAAWDAVHEAVPARWRVGRPSFDPAADGRWSVTAIDRRQAGRGKVPSSVTGFGKSEAAALHDLDDRLRGVARPTGSSLDAMRARLRMAYVAGAEEWSREHCGRGLTKEGFAGVLRRYDGR
jgi:hypothetical protein